MLTQSKKNIVRQVVREMYVDRNGRAVRITYGCVLVTVDESGGNDDESGGNDEYLLDPEISARAEKLEWVK